VTSGPSKDSSDGDHWKQHRDPNMLWIKRAQPNTSRRVGSYRQLEVPPREKVSIKARPAPATLQVTFVALSNTQRKQLILWRLSGTDNFCILGMQERVGAPAFMRGKEPRSLLASTLIKPTASSSRLAGYGFVVGRSSTSLTNEVGAWVTSMATTWATSLG